VRRKHDGALERRESGSNAVESSGPGGPNSCAVNLRATRRDAARLQDGATRDYERTYGPRAPVTSSDKTRPTRARGEMPFVISRMMMTKDRIVALDGAFCCRTGSSTPRALSPFLKPRSQVRFLPGAPAGDIAARTIRVSTFGRRERRREGSAHRRARARWDREAGLQQVLGPQH
jgi:hypothetical protein